MDKQVEESELRIKKLEEENNWLKALLAEYEARLKKLESDLNNGK